MDLVLWIPAYFLSVFSRPHLCPNAFTQPSRDLPWHQLLNAASEIRRIALGERGVITQSNGLGWLEKQNINSHQP